MRAGLFHPASVLLQEFLQLLQDRLAHRLGFYEDIGYDIGLRAIVCHDLLSLKFTVLCGEEKKSHLALTLLDNLMLALDYFQARRGV